MWTARPRSGGATTELAATGEMDESTYLYRYGNADPVGDGAVLLDAIAVDSKTLRGIRLGKNRQAHLLSAMTHAGRATIDQCNVETKTPAFARCSSPLAPEMRRLPQTRYTLNVSTNADWLKSRVHTMS